MTSSDILQVPEVNPEGDANLTTGPNVTGVGAGVSAGEFAFDAPDDQTCLRASLEGERRRRLVEKGRTDGGAEGAIGLGGEGDGGAPKSGKPEG